MDIIFGDIKPAYGKYTRSSGSLSDAEMIFGTSTSTQSKVDRFGSSKSMSMSSSSYGNSNTGGSKISSSYKIYEGIQNAAFSDYSEAGSTASVASSMPAGNTKAETISSITSEYTSRWNKAQEEDDDLDLK